MQNNVYRVQGKFEANNLFLFTLLFRHKIIVYEIFIRLQAWDLWLITGAHALHT